MDGLWDMIFYLESGIANLPRKLNARPG
jgi:hypothetical protein